MATLQIRPRQGDGAVIALGDEPVTIGRHPDNRVHVPGVKASRHHAVIEPDAEAGIGHRVRDLDSRNGTKLNGRRIAMATLNEGDVVLVGGLELLVERSPEAPAKPAAASQSPSNGDRPRAATPEWAIELAVVIDAVARRGEPSVLDRQARMIDSGERMTPALQRDGDGPLALSLLLLGAETAGATDVHLEHKGDKAQIRFRVDGSMVTLGTVPSTACDMAVRVVAQACGWRETSRDAVLDGHFGSKIDDVRFDYRASVTPSMHGPKLVLRIFDERNAPQSITDLGLAPYMEERMRSACRSDAGMVLVCGPTGSGKTTTLYNGMREIDRDTRNVITIEDPVEYRLDGVTQMPIDETRGHTYANLLRSVLRQDPDVILLGEIRDEETAQTALRAAMTGHLVFSTVHAKDSIAAVFRLLDLKAEPYLVAQALQIVIAQRLVRVLCEHCKREVRVTPGQATRIGRFLEGKTTVYEPVGCMKCLKTGFRGRQALFEMLDMNDDLRDTILSGPTIQAMKKVIEAGLFTTLEQSGWRMAARGMTSLDEISRVASRG